MACTHRGWGEAIVIGVAGAGKEIHARPFLLVTGRSWALLDLYRHYKAGFLPFEGGILSQPNSFSEAMLIIEAEINSE